MLTAGVMDCLVRQGEDGKSDHDLGLVRLRKTTAINAAATLVSYEIQVCPD